MIPPKSYCRDDFHHLEIDSIFARVWIFAGLLLELKEQSFLCVQIADRSVLLQVDNNGVTRAFLNVCSHRNSQLSDIGRHSGAIRCPYHGWVYDKQGVPVGIPSRASFPDVTADPLSYRLHEFPCETVGNFIFVRLSSNGSSLKEFLGFQYDFLEKISTGMNVVIDEFTKPVGANWKVVIENALEGYHVPAVHSKSFMQVEGMDSSENAPKFFFDDPHSYLEHAANSRWLSRFVRIEKAIGRWPFRFENYRHHFIFPNLTITSFMGYSFHVQVFRPTSVDFTLVHSRTISVEISNGTLVGQKMMDQIHADGIAFTHRVFDEDADICSKVQSGLRNAFRPAVLGNKIEDRVHFFHKAYLKFFD
jgi:choline monooxygenase